MPARLRALRPRQRQTPTHAVTLTLDPWQLRLLRRMSRELGITLEGLLDHIVVQEIMAWAWRQRCQTIQAKWRRRLAADRARSSLRKLPTADRT
jgi:hypothetical protein